MQYGPVARRQRSLSLQLGRRANSEDDKYGMLDHVMHYVGSCDLPIDVESPDLFIGYHSNDGKQLS